MKEKKLETERYVHVSNVSQGGTKNSGSPDRDDQGWQGASGGGDAEDASVGSVPRISRFFV